LFRFSSEVILTAAKIPTLNLQKGGAAAILVLLQPHLSQLDERQKNKEMER
jgi:hypothetical protein